MDIRVDESAGDWCFWRERIGSRCIVQRDTVEYLFYFNSLFLFYFFTLKLSLVLVKGNLFNNINFGEQVEEEGEE